MVVLLFFLSNNLFFFHLLGNFLYVVCCILWETVADDVILDFLCAYLAHHIVCASNCWIIYNSIMLIFNKEIISTVFSWREIDFGDAVLITHEKPKNLPQTIRYAYIEELTDIDAVIFGHSHRYFEKYVDGRLWLNPGSCGRRRFDQEITFAMMAMDGKNISVEKVTIPHGAV